MPATQNKQAKMTKAKPNFIENRSGRRLMMSLSISNIWAKHRSDGFLARATKIGLVVRTVSWVGWPPKEQHLQFTREFSRREA
jgi:hypothetical protein